jgi:phage FluMu protein gp41
MSIFQVYTPVQPEEVQREMEMGVSHPHDAGADVLPFGQLSDRQFEIVAYRLLAGAHHDKRVTLMQGVAERGRDVLIHSSQGQLEVVVQCKLHQVKLTEPLVCKEILKFALYCFLDPGLLGPHPVRYEIWCPDGLTEPAAELFDKWPGSWTRVDLASRFLEVQRDYGAFKGLDWGAVAKWVTTDFPRKVIPAKITGIDISAKVRANVTVYQWYFTVTVALPTEATQEWLQEQFSTGNLVQLSDEDLRHIYERAKSFQPEERFYLGSNYLMGVPREVLARMKREELSRLALTSNPALAGIPLLLVDVLGRIFEEEVVNFMGTHPAKSKIFGYVLSDVLRHQVLLRFEPQELMGVADLVIKTRLSQYRAKTNEELFRMLSEKACDQLLKDSPSDKEKSLRLLDEDFGKHASDVLVLIGRLMKLVPRKIMVVSDTQGPLGDEKLMQRVVDSGNRITGEK